MATRMAGKGILRMVQTTAIPSPSETPQAHPSRRAEQQRSAQIACLLQTRELQ